MDPNIIVAGAGAFAAAAVAATGSWAYQRRRRVRFVRTHANEWVATTPAGHFTVTRTGDHNYEILHTVTSPASQPIQRVYYGNATMGDVTARVESLTNERNHR